MYTYCFIMVLTPLVYAIGCFGRKSMFPQYIMVCIDGVMRPQNEASGSVKFLQLIKADAIVALQIQHLVVLLTFGIACPLLAIICCLAICSTTLVWQFIIVRYINYYYYVYGTISNCPISLYVSGTTRTTITSASKNPLHSSQTVDENKSVAFGNNDATKSNCSLRNEESDKVSAGEGITNDGQVELGTIEVMGPDEEGNVSDCQSVEIMEDYFAYSTLYLEPRQSHLININKTETSSSGITGKDSKHEQDKEALITESKYKNVNDAVSGNSGSDNQVSENRIISKETEEMCFEKALQAELTLDAECGNSWRGLRESTFVLVLVTSLFYAFILYDITADSSSHINAFIICAYCCVFIPVVLWVYYRLYDREYEEA